LKRQWFHILLALADEDRHGNAIVREVLDQTDGDLRLWPVMLYKSLEDLAAEGFIVELTDPRDRPAESEKRRYFRITATGRKRLAAESDRLVGLGAAARAKLALGDGDMP
jgi:DNA-binding PadR family transcriptional regulator